MLGVDAFEHGRVFEHVGHDHEAHPGAADEQVVHLGHAPVLGGGGHVLQLAVPVVLRLEQLATVHLAALQLHRHNVALCLMH